MNLIKKMNKPQADDRAYRQSPRTKGSMQVRFDEEGLLLIAKAVRVVKSGSVMLPAHAPNEAMIRLKQLLPGVKVERRGSMA